MLQVTYRRGSELVPYERNARTHSEAQVAQIAAAIEQFGWTNPVLIDERDGVIAGHGRLAAASLIGHELVPTICIAGLTDSQRRALVIADNKLALNAGWNDALLAAEVQALLMTDIDVSLLGFNEADMLYLSGGGANFQPGSTADQGQLDKTEPIICPACGHEFKR